MNRIPIPPSTPLHSAPDCGGAGGGAEAGGGESGVDRTDGKEDKGQIGGGVDITAVSPSRYKRYKDTVFTRT